MLSDPKWRPDLRVEFMYPVSSTAADVFSHLVGLADERDPLRAEPRSTRGGAAPRSTRVGGGNGDAFGRVGGGLLRVCRVGVSGRVHESRLADPITAVGGAARDGVLLARVRRHRHAPGVPRADPRRRHGGVRRGPRGARQRARRPGPRARRVRGARAPPGVPRGRGRRRPRRPDGRQNASSAATRGRPPSFPRRASRPARCARTSRPWSC